MSEQDSGYSRWSSDELLTGAEQGFELAHAYVQPDADVVRAEAASVFELAAGQKLLDELMTQGITLDQLERLPPHEVQHLIDMLAPNAMRKIRERVAPLDARAKNALEDQAYQTYRENGFTKND